MNLIKSKRIVFAVTCVELRLTNITRIFSAMDDNDEEEDEEEEEEEEEEETAADDSGAAEAPSSKELESMESAFAAVKIDG